MCTKKEQSQLWHESIFLPINPLNNFRWEKVLSPWQVLWDLTCLQTSERRDAWNICDILHTLLEVPVQAPHLFQIVLGKGSSLLPSERSELNCVLQREREAKAIIHISVAAFMLAAVFSGDQISREEKRRRRTQGGKKGLRQSWWCFLPGAVQLQLSNCYGYTLKNTCGSQETCCDFCL